MDITASSFYHRLPEILTQLSDCCFVAMDLEFSGIPIPSQKPDRKWSLQERYMYTKRCAEKYQILQVGLTIGHEDVDGGKYILRPYNLYLNPIIDQGLDLQRDFTLQSNGHNFSMSALYDRGVGYLSSREVSRALASATKKESRPATRPTLTLDNGEPESIAFLNTVRTLVDEWIGHGDVQVRPSPTPARRPLTAGQSRDRYLNIPPPRRSTDAAESSLMPCELSRHQQRLVRRLIETEYPYLTTKSMGPFAQIIEYDENQEAVREANRMTNQKQRILKSKGFGWVADALVGGDLSDLDPDCFQSDASDGRPLANKKDVADVVKQRLRTNQFLLVGHNLFVDLVYFCRCFVGPLPHRVEDFQVMVRRLFPRVMDTKYLATHDCGDLNPTSTLSKINQDILYMGEPLIVLHDRHRKYSVTPAQHEAGYDSLLTARAFLKLSVHLRTTVPKTTPEELSHMSATSERMEAAFGPEPPSRSPRLSDSDAAHAKAVRDQLIPRSGARFWENYGNRLRMFGTRERMCYLG